MFDMACGILLKTGSRTYCTNAPLCVTRRMMIPARKTVPKNRSIVRCPAIVSRNCRPMKITNSALRIGNRTPVSAVITASIVACRFAILVEAISTKLTPMMLATGFTYSVAPRLAGDRRIPLLGLLAAVLLRPLLINVCLRLLQKLQVLDVVALVGEIQMLGIDAGADGGDGRNVRLLLNAVFQLSQRSEALGDAVHSGLRLPLQVCGCNLPPLHFLRGKIIALRRVVLILVIERLTGARQVRPEIQARHGR